MTFLQPVVELGPALNYIQAGFESPLARIYNHRMSTRADPGYVALIRENPDFTRLWISQLISQTGDWFNSVALFTLLLSLSGTGQAVSYVLILKLLPAFNQSNLELIALALPIHLGLWLGLRTREPS